MTTRRGRVQFPLGLAILTGERFTARLRGGTPGPPRYYAFNALRRAEERTQEIGTHIFTCSCITAGNADVERKQVLVRNLWRLMQDCVFFLMGTIAALLVTAVSQSNATCESRANTDYSIRGFDRVCVCAGSWRGKVLL